MNDTPLQTQDSKSEPPILGRARYLSVTDAPRNTEALRVSGEETLCFFET